MIRIRGWAEAGERADGRMPESCCESAPWREGELRRCGISGLLLKMYASRIRRVRNLAYRLMLKLEGGEMYSWTLRETLLRYWGVMLGAYSYGQGAIPGAFGHGVKIGRYVSIAAEALVLRRNHLVECLSTHPFFFNSQLGCVSQDTVELRPLEIAHDAWVGARAIVTPGCRRIGIGAIIGAGAVVTKDVPDFAVMGGNPARLIKYRFGDEARRAVLASRWWEKSIDQIKPMIADMNKILGPDVDWHPLLRRAATAA